MLDGCDSPELIGESAGLLAAVRSDGIADTASQKRIIKELVTLTQSKKPEVRQAAKEALGLLFAENKSYATEAVNLGLLPHLIDSLKTHPEDMVATLNCLAGLNRAKRIHSFKDKMGDHTPQSLVSRLEVVIKTNRDDLNIVSPAMEVLATLLKGKCKLDDQPTMLSNLYRESGVAV